MAISIKDITTNPETQKLLRQFGNQDDTLTSDEIPIDEYEMLDCNEQTVLWTVAEFNSVQAALYSSGLITTLRTESCADSTTHVYPGAEHIPFIPINLRKIDESELEKLLSRKDYEMAKDQLPELEQIPFVADLIADIEQANVSTVDELSDILVRELKTGIEYSPMLGAERTRHPESWHFENRQAVCDSFARMYCALFDLLVSSCFPEFSSYKALRISGRAATSLDDYLSGHTYNVIIGREDGELRIKIVDPTFGKTECTRERKADFIYFLYAEDVITREEAIHQLDEMIEIDPENSSRDPGRKWAMTNRILINNESVDTRIESIEMICRYLKGVKNVTDDEINHTLGMPIEEYLIFGNQKSCRFSDRSVHNFAEGVSRRAREMMTMLTKEGFLEEPWKSGFLFRSLYRRLLLAYRAAVRICGKINNGEVQNVAELAPDLKDILGKVHRTRKNKDVVDLFLSAGII